MAVGRLIVLGGRGAFGRMAADSLQAMGIRSVIASRHPCASVRLDAEDPSSLRSALRAGDVVIDAAGPFQDRSLALIEAAIEIGFDVIDLNDHVDYAEGILGLESRIAQAGIRILPSASTASAIAAAVVQDSGIDEPVRVTSLLVPVTRGRFKPGSARSFLRSVGRPVRVWRDGSWQITRSRSMEFSMPEPIGAIRARLTQSVDSLWLPRIWPSLRAAEMFVDTNVPGGDTLLAIAARFPLLRAALECATPLAGLALRAIGRDYGGLGYEIESAERTRRYALLCSSANQAMAVAPAVLAARAIVEGRLSATGLILPGRSVSCDELWTHCRDLGIEPVQI